MTVRDYRFPSRPSWSDLQEAGDHDLVEYWLCGIEDAFAAIVDRYRHLVFSVALRIVQDRAEAEDVVQIVFLEIFRHAGKFDPTRGTLRMWVLQYAYSRSINRRQQLEQRCFYSNVGLDALRHGDASTQPTGKGALSCEDSSRLVNQALAQLNPGQREAIELIYFDGLSFAEAVKKSGHSLPQLRHRYYRGLTKIREFIGSKRFPVKEDSGPLAATVLRQEAWNAKP